MKDIFIKRIVISNFKGCKELVITFKEKTRIGGMNASGKSTIFDALCWLLFNKDSLGQTDFSIRPLDESGKQVDMIDISVTVILSVDGEDYELKKIQKQNWVKKRGSDHPTFQGNVNSFEVDGYPKKEKEFKEFVSSLIDEDTFKLLTNPMQFTSGAWKDQRAALMRFVSDKTDFDLASEKEEFSLIAKELKKASTDDIQKKYTGQRKELNKRLDEYPIRIDELEKSKADVNEKELLAEKAEINEKIADCDKRIAEASNEKEIELLRSEVFALKEKKMDMIESARRELAKKRDALSAEILDITSALEKCKAKIGYYEEQRGISKKRADLLESEERKLLNDKQEVENSTFNESEWEYDEKDEYCKFCGQRLPAERVDGIKAAFEQRKSEAKIHFNKEKAERIKAISDRIISINEEIKSLNQASAEDVGEVTEAKEYLTKKLAEKTAERITLPPEPDFMGNNEYKQVDDEIFEKTEKIQNLLEKADVSPIECEKSTHQAALRDIERKLALVKANKDICDRIDMLTAEQRDTAQKAADAERFLDVLGRFVRYKMQTVSDEINSHFNTVKFKLFSEQINGGIKETCEATVNGVPYGSLNNGHRIIAGLEIIKAFQELTGVRTTVWIDNAEAVNDFNLPEMDCQVVLLTVSDDKELKIE